jgi:hypothetical protein
MEMRDRLMELLRQVDFDYSEECVVCCEDGYKCTPDLAEFFADHLLANGVIVPPCKVGDVVWFDTYKKSGTVSLGIQPHKVGRIDVICVVGEKELVETKLHDWYFGDSVFLTKDEAVKALKEREGNG